MKELAHLLSCPSTEVEKRVCDMTEKEIVALANQLLTISKFFKNAQLKAALFRKIAKIDARIGVVEKGVFGKSAPSSMPKAKLWPSISSGDEDA